MFIIAEYLQQKYANLVMSQIESMTVENHQDFLARGRCPICGDSHKNKSKKRFYFYMVKGTLLVKCHNCGYSTTFVKFLKNFNRPMYDQLMVEAFRDNGIKPKKKEISLEEQVIKSNISDAWKQVIFPAKEVETGLEFLKYRQFPESKWDRVYITDSILKSYNRIRKLLNLPDVEKNYPDMPAIAFPFIDSRGSLTHINYRNLDPKSKFRYITAEFNDGQKVFGLDKLNDSSDVYVVEGPADSLFLDNCIAMADAGLDRAKHIITKSRLILVPDNEPRSPVQVKKIGEFIKNGFRVFIPPIDLVYKDLNDMAKAGLDVKKLVSENVYTDMMAKFKYNNWKKI